MDTRGVKSIAVERSRTGAVAVPSVENKKEFIGNHSLCFFFLFYSDINLIPRSAV